MVVLPRALKQFIEHFTFTHFVIRLIKEDGVCSIVFRAKFSGCDNRFCLGIIEN
jgi:hypothetical protein